MKSFLLAHNIREVGTYTVKEGIDLKDKKVKEYGHVVRAGDVIKFGRVPIMIKESSFDTGKHKKIKETLQLSRSPEITHKGMQNK